MATIKKRMPKDPNKLAARIVQLATGEKRQAIGMRKRKKRT